MQTATISDVETTAMALVSMIADLKGKITDDVDFRLCTVESVIQDAIQDALS